MDAIHLAAIPAALQVEISLLKQDNLQIHMIASKQCRHQREMTSRCANRIN